MVEELKPVPHFTDGQSVEELARRYPGSAESHVMLHRKLDAISDKLVELMKYFEHKAVDSE